jgi:HK97 family phage portal protein
VGLLSNVFGKVVYKLMNGYYGYRATSSPWNKDAYEQETVRAIIDCIATHAAKGQAMHVILDKDGRIKEIKRNSTYAKMINQKPNPLMSGFDFKYRIISALETKTASAVFVKWKEGSKPIIPEIMIPIDFDRYEILPIIGGGYAIQFNDFEGVQRQLNIEDVVFLRKFYTNNEVSGDGNAPIYNTLDMIKASDTGFIEALTVSNKVRGLYQHKKAMLDPDDVQKSQDDFAKRFEAAAAKGGIVGIDSMENYAPLNVTPYSANAAQMKAVRDNLYTYWRVNENIVKSQYSEQEGHAFAESVIEPHWQRLGEAFTNVCFSAGERDAGNRIIFTGGVLIGTTYATRVAIIRDTKEIGLLTINEQRELLGYDPVEGGDIRQVSLNFINADKQDEYQTGKGDNNGDQKGNKPED